MKLVKTLSLAVLPLLFSATLATAGTIDFEELTTGSIGPNTYTSQGLTLDGTYQIYDNLQVGTNGSGAKSIHQNFNHFGGTFTNTVSSMSVLMGDWCCDFDTGTLSVFDESNTLLASISNSGSAWFTVGAMTAGIKSFSITGTNAVLFDQITFSSSVPEPSTLLLLGLGVFGLGLKRRRSS